MTGLALTAVTLIAPGIVVDHRFDQTLFESLHQVNYNLSMNPAHRFFQPANQTVDRES